MNSFKFSSKIFFGLTLGTLFASFLTFYIAPYIPVAHAVALTLNNCPSDYTIVTKAPLDTLVLDITGGTAPYAVAGYTKGTYDSVSKTYTATQSGQESFTVTDAVAASVPCSFKVAAPVSMTCDPYVPSGTLLDALNMGLAGGSGLYESYGIFPIPNFNLINKGPYTITVKDHLNVLNLFACPFMVSDLPIAITPPALNTIQIGGSDYQFLFTGGPDITSQALWSIDSFAPGNADPGTISPTGLYHQTKDIKLTSVTFKVVNKGPYAENNDDDALTIAVTQPLAFIITPPGVSDIVPDGPDYTFLWSGGPQDNNVIWSVVSSDAQNGDSGSFIDPVQGIYRPSTDLQITKVKVKVVDQYFPANFAELEVAYGKPFCRSNTFVLKNSANTLLSKVGVAGALNVYPNQVYRIYQTDAYTPTTTLTLNNGQASNIKIEDHYNSNYVDVSIGADAAANTNLATLAIKDAAVLNPNACKNEITFTTGADGALKPASPIVVRIGG